MVFLDVLNMEILREMVALPTVMRFDFVEAASSDVIFVSGHGV